MDADIAFIIHFHFEAARMEESRYAGRGRGRWNSAAIEDLDNIWLLLFLSKTRS